ncbi:MAG: GAF and ANTAR domain-containing protein [Solirubrobacterales bacterium]|nr:GAF and ANTAR domain-containing protein [Solirubrobacterales bacterium]
MSDGQYADQPAGPLHPELAGLLLSEQTVSELLAMIVGLAISTIEDVDGSSISLMSPNGRLETTSASSQEIRLVDTTQYQDEQGPCVEAIKTGREVVVALPIGQWPRFSDRAQQAGMRSVHSFPLRVRDRVTGALNLYSTSVTSIEPRTDAARSLAHQAATVLANAAALATAEMTNEQLQQALATRDLIGQAKGILMGRENIDADAAFDLLRRLSQRSGRKLKDIAAEVAAHPSDPKAR